MSSQGVDITPIKNYRLGNRDIFYVPNFLSEEEEQYILLKIRDSPRQKWKQLAHRRLQILGGEITTKGLLPQTLPSYLTLYPPVVGRLKETGAFIQSPHKQPNHVILNEYQPGQGIMPHEDGPNYFPVVATISLGSHTIFNYYQYKIDSTDVGGSEGKIVDSVPILSVLLEPRSLVVSSGDMYTSCLHGSVYAQGRLIHDANHCVPDSSTNHSIDSLQEDVVLSSIPAGLTSRRSENSDHSRILEGTTLIDNWESLGDEYTRQILANNGVLKRGTRYSLTCRDVKHVTSAKSFKFV